MGYATKDTITFRLENSAKVATLVEWVTDTVAGRAAYDAMLKSANDTFPEYVREVEGMSYGSGVDFKTLFTLNVRNELSSFKVNGEKLADTVEHCSDYLVNGLNQADGTNEILIGHNEVCTVAFDFCVWFTSTKLLISIYFLSSQIEIFRMAAGNPVIYLILLRPICMVKTFEKRYATHVSLMFLLFINHASSTSHFKLLSHSYQFWYI